MELRTAVAAQGTEDIPGEALAVHPNQDGIRPRDVPLDQGDVGMRVVVLQFAAVGVDAEEAEVRREIDLDPLFDQLLPGATPGDEVLHRDELQPMPFRERDQVRKPRHGPVVVHHPATEPGGGQPGQSHEVDRGLGMAGAHQDAALAGLQGKEVPGAQEILGTGFEIGQEAGRKGTLLRRNFFIGAFFWSIWCSSCGLWVSGWL